MGFRDRFFRQEKRKEIKRSPVLFEKTQELIAQLENFYKGDFITYWISHRTLISQDHINIFYRLLRSRVKSDHLFIFLKSNGGSGLTALRATHLFRELYKKVTVLVPLECASAATMMALGADTLKIGPMGFLTAIDTSTWHELGPTDNDYFPVGINHEELGRAIKLWEDKTQEKDSNPYNKLFKYIHPLAIGAIDRANDLSVQLATEILSYHYPDREKARSISQHLNSRYPDHGYPITFREAQRIGLPAESLEWESNDRLIRLHEHYSEMAETKRTDFSALKFHFNEITEVLEVNGEQIVFQKDFEYRYNKELRQWKAFNDESGWKSLTMGEENVESKKVYFN